jgi:hypothetical protein
LLLENLASFGKFGLFLKDLAPKKGLVILTFGLTQGRASALPFALGAIRPFTGGRLVATAVPVRVLLLLVWATLAQILVIAMCVVLPLAVVTVIANGLLRLLRLAANHRQGRSYRHCEQDWAEAPT